MKRKLPGFSGPALILLLGFTLLCILVPREQIHIFINSRHHPFLDLLMKYWTYLGDGWVLLAVVLFSLLIRIRMAFILLAAYAFSGLSAQFLKRFVFGQTPRPVKYFEIHDLPYDLHLVEGVHLHHWYSFPSGHTATAFGVFFGLSLFLRRPWKWIMLILALGVAYSRMYLSQHFLIDVTGGMVLGLLFAYLSWWYMRRYRSPWLDVSLPEVLKR